MEQIATNKEVVANATKKEVSFWNKPSTRLFILIGIILVTVWYFTEWEPKQACESEVRYYPATESRPAYKSDYVDLPAIPGVSEYYSYDGQKFKTREEAISYCANNN
jgi:hypothetical protein